MKRKKMNTKKSKRNFRNNSGVHAKNVSYPLHMRGGIRL
ncbi:MAG: DNA binding protein (J protein) [Microvirus sp.]|nr:MAG: DNA binding protein (J protein) [Microvirus sp.]